MKFKTCFLALAPILLAACATIDTTIDPTHPAHPEASVATTRALPQTLSVDPGASPRQPSTQPVQAPGPADDAASAWTCPMHPDVVRDEPGDCPICDMTLRRKESPTEEETAHDQHRKEPVPEQEAVHDQHREESAPEKEATHDHH